MTDQILEKKKVSVIFQSINCCEIIGDFSSLRLFTQLILKHLTFIIKIEEKGEKERQRKAGRKISRAMIKKYLNILFSPKFQNCDLLHHIPLSDVVN